MAAPSENSQGGDESGEGLLSVAGARSLQALVMLEMGFPICLSQKTKKSLKKTLDTHSHQRSQMVTTVGHDVHMSQKQMGWGGDSFPVTFIHRRSWGWVSDLP